MFSFFSMFSLFSFIIPFFPFLFVRADAKTRKKSSRSSFCKHVKCVSLQASVSEFNCRCFLCCRCSMEIWCPDDTGWDSWDWVGPLSLPRPCPGISQQKSATTGTAAGSAVAAASIGKLLETPKKTLRCIVSGKDTTHKSTLESTDRENAHNFCPRRHHYGRHRALPLDRTHGKFSLNVMKRSLGKPHKSIRTFAVDGSDLAEKMPCARRPFIAAPQRRAFARLRVVLWTRMRSEAEFLF